MPAGYIIAESIRPGSQLEGLSFTLSCIERYTVDNATDDQPAAWTMIHFEFPEDQVEAVANALLRCSISPAGTPIFVTEEDEIVIFPRRVFQYSRGDLAARAEAEAYARALGIPGPQLDW
jgi:hypothetical protein